MQIIPAIDIYEGKCVRLQKGDYNEQTVYSENPVEVARMFDDAGFERLHVVDLEGAKAGKIMNMEVLEDIANCTELIIDFGGGIKTMQDAEDVLTAGADFLTLGSIAVTNTPGVMEMIDAYGADRILIGADVLDDEIMIHGWQKKAGVNITDFIKSMRALGVRNFFCTDISRDGMLQGCSVDLYAKLLQQFDDIHLIASGGVTSLQDLHDLRSTGCSGAIIGKALYEGNLSLRELITFNL